MPDSVRVTLCGFTTSAAYQVNVFHFSHFNFQWVLGENVDLHLRYLRSVRNPLSLFTLALTIRTAFAPFKGHILKLRISESLLSENPILHLSEAHPLSFPTASVVPTTFYRCRLSLTRLQDPSGLTLRLSGYGPVLTFILLRVRRRTSVWPPR